MDNKGQFDRAYEDAKREVCKLKQCRHCVFANEDKTWCLENKIPIRTPVQVGCNKHMTDDEALKKIAEEQFEQSVKDLRRMQLELDIMGYEISAAAQTLEKIDMELKASYEAIVDKDEECIKNHKESQKNRDRLAKAYAQMKVHAQDMRNTYNRYVEYFFNAIYTDEKGKYQWKESEKTLRNSGYINMFVRVLVDKTLDNAENAQKIMDFMKSLKGCGVYDGHHAEKFVIKK